MTLRIARLAIASTLLSLATAASANGPGYMTGHPVPAPHTAALQQEFRVDLNHSGLLRLPLPASAVIVGNPNVADVAVHRSDTLLVLGRGYGSTNLLVMDTAGRVMADYQIVVGMREAGIVRIHNGGARQTYSCTPDCLPAPHLGDSPDFIGMNSATATEIQNLTAGPAQPSPLPPAQTFTPPNVPGPGVPGLGAPNSGPSGFPEGFIPNPS